MNHKFIIFTIFVLISNKESIEQEKPVRGTRTYGDSLSVDRSVKPQFKKINDSTGTSGINTTLNLKPPKIIADKLVDTEPLDCEQCLSDRYLAHYVERGCKPIEGENFCRKSCPKYFQCPKRASNTALKGCEYKGKVYKLQEDIPVRNPCKTDCYCNQNLNDKNISNPIITCEKVDCPINLRAPDTNCTYIYVYELGKCCGEEKCLTRKQVSTQKKCLYGGQQYKLGQRIFPKEDPCVECICDRSWNQTKPLLNKSCKKIDCDLQSNDKFRAGCLPIYSEQTCCPMDYYCPQPEEHQCTFNGKKYLIGEKIDVGLSSTECKCIVPPDFTCIHRDFKVTPEVDPRVLGIIAGWI